MLNSRGTHVKLVETRIYPLEHCVKLRHSSTSDNDLEDRRTEALENTLEHALDLVEWARERLLWNGLTRELVGMREVVQLLKGVEALACLESR